MALDITFFGVLLFVTFIGSVILYFFEKDDTYKLIHFFYSVFSFAMLVFVAYLMLAQDFGVVSDSDVYSLGGFSVDNPVFIGVFELVDNSSYLFSGYPVNDKKVDLVGFGEFCFYYNNSDESNVGVVTSSGLPVTRQVHISNNSVGSVCASLNVSVDSNSLLGFKCDDCSGGNSLGIRTVSGGGDLVVISDDLASYNIISSDGFAFWIGTKSAPFDLVRRFFLFGYLTGLFGFILAYGFRWGYKYVSEDYSEDFS